MQVTSAQLAAHYAKLYGRIGCIERLSSAIASRALHVAHNKSNDGSKLAQATLAAHDAEIVALRLAIA